MTLLGEIPSARRDRKKESKKIAYRAMSYSIKFSSKRDRYRARACPAIKLSSILFIHSTNDNALSHKCPVIASYQARSPDGIFMRASPRITTGPPDNTPMLTLKVVLEVVPVRTRLPYRPSGTVMPKDCYPELG